MYEVKNSENKEMFLKLLLRNFFNFSLGYGEGEGEVAFFSAKRWDRRNRADLIESATPCHDAQVVGLYWGSNPLRLTILAAMSEDYTTAIHSKRKKTTVRGKWPSSLYNFCQVTEVNLGRVRSNSR